MTSVSGANATLLATLLLLCAGEPVDPWKPWTEDGKPQYVVKQTSAAPALSGAWKGDIWQGANELRLEHFLAQNGEGLKAGDFQPDVRARVLYDSAALYVFFRVEDRYVRSVATQYRGKVWEDACAEFFVQPKADRGYFNFEINCGGTMLVSYHEHPDWKGETKAKPGGVPWDSARGIDVYHSMPNVVHPEITEEALWHLEYRIPLSMLEDYVGPLGELPGQAWRANFYKCAEINSHPNWATWSPIVEGDNFHSPRYFGILRFE